MTKLISAAEVERVVVECLKRQVEAGAIVAARGESASVEVYLAKEVLLDDLLGEFRALPDATPSPGEGERLRHVLEAIQSRLHNRSSLQTHEVAILETIRAALAEYRKRRDS